MDIFGFTAVAGAGVELGRLALRLSYQAGGGAVTGPLNACGCAPKAGAGTELRTAGTLNRAAEPWGGAVTGPIDACGCAAKAGAGTELRTVAL